MGSSRTADAAASLAEWRDQTTHQVLALMAGGGLPLLMFALARPSVTWSLGPAVVYLLAYGLVALALVGRRLAQPVRGWLAVLPFFALATVSLLRTGWMGNARILLLGAPLMGFILVGPRSGWAAAAVSLTLYLAFSWAAAAGMLEATFVAPAHPLSVGDWAYQGALAMVVLVPTLGYLARYHRFQANLAARWRGMALRLSDEVDRRRTVEDAFLDFTDRERRRLGLELHDGLCQELAGSRLICDSVAARLTEADSPALDPLRRLGASLDDALDQAYGIARGLGADVPEDGLAAALESLARRIEDRFRIRCTFERPQDVRMPSREAATQLLRIAQEAVNNAIRHGAPARIHLRLTCEDHGLILEVRDDGSGFPSNVVRGLGLDAMEHRALRIGARLAIGSDQEGTCVRCVVPRSPQAG